MKTVRAEIRSRKARAAKLRAAAKPFAEELHGRCGSHPEGGRHEAMPEEMRCAYCGRRLMAKCNGCGRFLTLAEMHRHESRCDSCA